MDVVRKNIKNLHLAVYPPMGRVRVAAPLLVSDEAVRLAVISRLPWIKRQKSRFQRQARQSERQFVTGECHYFQGRRYRLNVIYLDGRSQVVIRNKSTIDLIVQEDADQTYRQKIMLAWYRQQLKQMIPELIQKWEPVIGVKVADWRIKHMKTKWGTCNIEARRIWLNLELMKKSPQCLEYIVVHEMVHLLERHHNERFTGMMNQFLPLWRLRRDELNDSALGHEEWGY